MEDGCLFHQGHCIEIPDEYLALDMGSMRGRLLVVACSRTERLGTVPSEL